MRMHRRYMDGRTFAGYSWFNKYWETLHRRRHNRSQCTTCHTHRTRRLTLYVSMLCRTTRQTAITYRYGKCIIYHACVLYLYNIYQGVYIYTLYDNIFMYTCMYIYNIHIFIRTIWNYVLPAFLFYYTHMWFLTPGSFNIPSKVVVVNNMLLFMVN